MILLHAKIDSHYPIYNQATIYFYIIKKINNFFQDVVYITFLSAPLTIVNVKYEFFDIRQHANLASTKGSSCKVLQMIHGDVIVI